MVCGGRCEGGCIVDRTELCLPMYICTYIYMCNSLVICTLIFRHFKNSSIRMSVAISALPLSPPLLSLSLHPPGPTQSGSWVCFAELLSLSQEVLSLFGHLLQTITAAVKARQDACTFFNGKKVRMYVVAEDL